MSDHNRTPKTSSVALWPPKRWLGQWVRMTTGTSSGEESPGHPREITPPFPAPGIPGCSSGAAWPRPLTQTRISGGNTELRGNINIQTQSLIWWWKIKGNRCTSFNFQSRCSVHINFSNHFLFSLSTVQLRAKKKSWFDFQSCMGFVSLHQVVNVGSSKSSQPRSISPECWQRQFLCLVHQWKAGARMVETSDSSDPFLPC